MGKTSTEVRSLSIVHRAFSICYLTLMLAAAAPAANPTFFGHNFTLPGGGGGNPIGVAQSAWVRGSTSPQTISLPSVQSGSLVVVVVFNAGQAPPIPTDGVGTYQFDFGFDGGSTPRLSAFSRRTAASGSLTINLTNTTSTHQIAACAYEITNAAASGWFDGGLTSQGTGTAVATVPFNTSGPGVIICMHVDGSGSNPTTKTAGTGYAISAGGAAHEDNASSFWSTLAEHQVTTRAFIHTNATLTIGSSQSWNELVVSYVQTASANNYVLTDFENGNDGDTLTTNIATITGYGVVSNAWNTGPTAGQALTAKVKVGYNTNIFTPSLAAVAGTNHDGSGTRSVGMVNSTFEYLDYSFPRAVSNASIGYFFTPGMTNPADSTFYDSAMIGGALDFAVVSVQMVGTSPTVPVKVHTQSGSSAGTINLTALHTYWITLAYKAGDKAYLRAYDPAASWVQVGSEVSLAVSNYPCNSFRIGENHGVAPPSTTVSWYDNITIDTMKGTYPLGP
jgi:hypothetical protein